MSLFKLVLNRVTSIFRKHHCYICGGHAETYLGYGNYICYDHLRDLDDPDYPPEDEVCNT